MTTPDGWPPALKGLSGYLAEELGDASTADFCLRWIAACAAYPLLRWPITTALGEALAGAEGRPPPDESAHLAVGRLPWFREGRMPLDIRLALLRWQDAGDRRLVRDTLVDILTQALDRQTSTAPPKATARGHGRALARVVEDLPNDALQADPLLPLILRGRRPGALNLGLARLRMLTPPRLRPWTRLSRLSAAALVVGTAAAVILVGPALVGPFDRWAPRAQDRFDIVHVRLSACQAPPGAGTTLQVSETGVMKLKRSVVLSKTQTWRQGFDRIVVAPALQMAVTQEAAGPTRLWNFQGGQSVILKGQAGDIDGLDALPLEAGYVAETTTAKNGEGQTWDETGELMDDLPTEGRPPPASQETIQFRSRTGRLYAAVWLEDGVKIGAPSNPFDLLVSLAWDAPLGGIGLTEDDRLVMFTCDPAGVVIPKGGLTASVAGPTPAGPQLIEPTPGEVVEWPAPTVEGMRVERSFAIFFLFDSYALSSEAQAVLGEAAAASKALNPSRIMIVAHTDDTQSREAALALSSRYANSARDGLVALGVPSGQIFTLAAGKERPAVRTAGPEPLNRRAIIYLYVADNPPPPPVDPPTGLVDGSGPPRRTVFRGGQYQVTSSLVDATASGFFAAQPATVCLTEKTFGAALSGQPDSCSWTLFSFDDGGDLTIRGVCVINGASLIANGQGQYDETSFSLTFLAKMPVNGGFGSAANERRGQIAGKLYEGIACKDGGQ